MSPHSYLPEVVDFTVVEPDQGGHWTIVIGELLKRPIVVVIDLFQNSNGSEEGSVVED